MFDDELENNNEEIIDVNAIEETKPAKSKSKKNSTKEPTEEIVENVVEEIVEDKTEKVIEEEVFIPEDNGIEIGKAVTDDGVVTVQPVKFASFDQMDQVNGEENKNLDILMDVKLQLNVELGRCELPIKKVLELTRGSIIELDKVAGESVELFANGKLIAQGEVVVIDDNFGLRITSITEPDNRIN